MTKELDCPSSPSGEILLAYGEFNRGDCQWTETLIPKMRLAPARAVEKISGAVKAAGRPPFES